MVLALSVSLSAMAANTGNSVEYYKQIEQKANSEIKKNAPQLKKLEDDVAEKKMAVEKADIAVIDAQVKLKNEGGYANSQALLAAQRAKQAAELDLAKTQVQFEEASAETEKAKVAAARANALATSKNASKEQIEAAFQQASDAQKKAKEAAEKAKQATENLKKLKKQQKNSGPLHGLSFHQLVDHNYGNYQKMMDDTIK